MRWLASKLFETAFGRIAPIFDFAGDHRWGAIALLFAIGAVAALFLMPVFKRQVAAGLAGVALIIAIYDAGYSHRAKIDRAAWEQAEQARKAAEDAERARRIDEIAKARRDAEAAADALKSQQEEHARYMVEIDNASKANDNRPCLDAASVVRLDRAGRRKKAR